MAFCLFLLHTGITAQAANQIQRLLPAAINQDSPFTVTNLVSAADHILAYAVEERIPTGWGVSQINLAGQVDLETGKIKWGPFFDHQPRALTYRLRAPAGAKGEFSISGTGSFDGEIVPITGVSRLRIDTGAETEDRNEVLSSLLPRFVPGATFSLTNKVRLAPDTIAYAVEDQVPNGWTVGVLNQSGQYDPASGRIKWGPFLDRVARELIAELRPPLTSTGLVTLTGIGSFDGVEMPITGQRQTKASLGDVVSGMPAEFQANERITIRLVATPTDSTVAFAVEDQPPAGWPVSEISHGGSFDAAKRVVKFGPLFTNAVTTLSYMVTAPSLVSNVVVRFSGAASFDTFAVAITGRRDMTGLGSKAVRLMPTNFVAGLPFRVTNQVTLDSVASVYAVEDTVPPGWIASEISDEGIFEAGSGRVKWGPFIDKQARALSYTALSPPSAQGMATFAGTASFDGLPVSITGQQTTVGVSVASLNRIVRSMAESVRVGRSILVTNRVAVIEGVNAFAIEEQLPAGWTATNINHGGAFDVLQSKVKWGPYFDALSRELVYQLSPATNAGGLVNLSGIGSFSGERVATTGASSLLSIANHVPIAQEDLFTRLIGQPLSLSVTNLLANDSDPDGDLVTVLEVAAASTGGVPVIVSNGVITYTPPAGFDQTDEFPYQITDGFGGTTTGLIKVVPVKPSLGANRVSLDTLVGGSVHLRFVGIPGRAYRIQAAESLVAPKWATLGTRTATARGDLDFEDSEASFFPSRFYRTVWP